MKHLYGFKNKETGLFMPTYQGYRYKSKIAFFRKKHNAERAFECLEPKERKLYETSEVCEIE